MAESVGLGAAATGYSWRLWAGDLVPTALAAGRPGVSGLGGWALAGGWPGASRASGGVAHKN